MYDDLDLRVIERGHDADPHYRAALRRRVTAILDGSEAEPLAIATPPAATIDLAEPRPIPPKRHRRRWVGAAAAAAAAAAIVVTLIVVTTDKETLAPADETVPTTVPPADETAPAADPSADETQPTTDPDVDETEPDTETAPGATPPSDLAEIAPGEMVELPDWPLSSRRTPLMFVAGTELIVWGGDTQNVAGAGDGAAFDLANGTWRVIAQAPIAPRSEPALAWTGTEMIVWGGGVGDVNHSDGAAYDPSTDTWRLLASAPVDLDVGHAIMVWTGDEALILGDRAAAYDPVADRWRMLADPPFWFSSVGSPGPVWTGDSIVVTDVGVFAEPDLTRMMRYDLAADRWAVVEIDLSAAVVGVPGAEGPVGTFVSLPSETGAPVQLIDSTGSLIAELPAFPADPDVFGDDLWAYGLWAGDEAVFEIWSDGPDYETEQIWALNPSTQAWRQLDADTAFPRIDRWTVAADDLLLMWGRGTTAYMGPPEGPRSCCVAPAGKVGSVYRVGIPPTG